MMLLKENLSVIIERHPLHESLNVKIIEDARDFGYGGVSKVRPPETSSYSIISSPSIELIYNWMLILLESENKGWSFEVQNSWFVRYGKDQSALSHHHHPADFSFVYFIRCPKGSSPLVFTTSGKKIKAEEGKVAIFPGNLSHHVPKNKSDGRMVLAGNIWTTSMTQTAETNPRNNFK